MHLKIALKRPEIFSFHCQFSISHLNKGQSSERDSRRQTVLYEVSGEANNQAQPPAEQISVPSK